MPRSPPQQNGHRNIPILPSSTIPASIPVVVELNNHGEPMDITPPASVKMGPPSQSSPEMDHSGGMTNGAYADPNHTQGGTSGGLSAAAAASSQQPKVVQTAFIHKLYTMLEDPSIQELISWSNNNESFVMTPSTDFSRVLSQYFKHTNISSFVRQLNMYGFHKVSDVFHTGSPESAMWEFKHGNGNFKRGDTAGLREIKRRASRHSLIHRDSFTSPHKPSVSQPGTPAEPLQDSEDRRLSALEQCINELHNRLLRTEENNAVLLSRCQSLNDGLVKYQQWSREICGFVTSILPEQESQIRRELSSMQQEMQQFNVVRTDETHESLLSARPQFFSGLDPLDAAPLSPRQRPQDDRRPSLQAVRPAFKSHQSSQYGPSPRRYGSIGTASGIPPTANPTPNFPRSLHHPPAPIQPPPPQPQHPLASVTSPDGPNLARRHTAADIRVPNWNGPSGSPFASGHSSSHWPSSPHQNTSATDQDLRDSLASYQMGVPRRESHYSPHYSPQQPTTHQQQQQQQQQQQPSFSFSSGLQQATPPLTTSNDTTPSTLSVESGWSLGASKFPTRFAGDSAPQTRRSSMASNVHSLLNPAETVERDEDDLGPDERKRKRVG